MRRPLLEKKSDGLFECAYTPRKTQKLVICVNYGGVAVPDSPFRVTVDDPTDPNKVKVYGKGLEDGNKTGKPVEFTVDCKEAGPGDLAINITDDKGNDVPINIKDNSNQTFDVQYNPKKNGPHIIDVKYDGRDVPQSPITVNIKTDIDLRKIKVVGLNDEPFVDCTNDFDVDTSALPSNVTPNIGCSIKTPDGSNLKDLRVDHPGPDRPDLAGKAKVSYTPNKEGKHEINVTCDGDPIHGSPFKVKAKNGCDPKKVKAYGPGLEKGICHEPNQFTIETRNAGKGDLGLSIEGPAEAKMTCKDNSDGSCDVDYIPTKPGNYEILVNYGDKKIPGSPFKVPVVDLSDNGLTGSDGANPLSDLPNGKLNIKVIKAKELIKADLIGKSDPYVQISYGQQKFKTHTVKNSLEPKWNYDLDLKIESHYTEVKFEVFDADKIGKDKSLGVVNIDIGELASINDSEGRWYSLTGVKSGQILLSADFIELDNLENVNPLGPKSAAKAPGLGASGKGGNDNNDDDDGKSKLPNYGQLPPGRAQVFLVKAKELIKADVIGKSDPYAKISYGSQNHKTATVKNTLEPMWNYCANFDIPEGNTRNVTVEVFDADKLGRDKSLGKVEVDLAELVNNEDAEGHWYPLIGVKSGKVLLFADFQEHGSYDPNDTNYVPHTNKSDDGPRSSIHDDTDDGANDGGINLPSGTAKINLIKAADLIKADLIGKSDPYAVLSHGNQKDKTKTVKNTQEPIWNHVSEFKVPDNDNCRTFNIEVFDSDKIGKDKSLGKLSLDIIDVLELDGAADGKWFPLNGVKSGKVLLSADFLDDLGRRASDILPSLLKHGDPRRKGSKVGGDSGSPINNDGVGNNNASNPNKHPSALNGDVPKVPASALPSGKAKINLIKAKELIQADKGSLSDPYAMLLYGKQVEKTKTIQNSHEPEWNHEAEFDFPEGDERTFRIELFDSDRVGKDSSLGHLDLDITDVLALDGQTGKWFPLSGVASGQVLLSADFIDDLGRNPGDLLNNLLNGLDANGKPIRKSSADPLSGKDSGENLPNGVATINLIKAKNLMKLDPSQKTHPYAVLIHGKQMEKTKIVKNTTEPQWDHKAKFDVPDGGNAREFTIQVLDSKKDEKDKPLGAVSLDLVDVLKMDGDKKGKWIPLDGADSGEILLAADFLDSLGRKAEDVLKDLLKNDQDRKKSAGPLGKDGTPSALNGEVPKVPGSALPSGKAKINLIKAKELIQADKTSKSDPYAMLLYGKQVEKTKVVPNSHEPEWNHEAEFDFPEDDERNFRIELFDSDKVGKDTTLGHLDLDITDILALDGQTGTWFPLSGVPSGKVLLSADFIDDLGRNPGDLLDNLLKGLDANGKPIRKSLIDPLAGKSPGEDLPNGVATINLIKAKNLMKVDPTSTTDPYAVLTHGKQMEKTKMIKNTTEPQWNHESKFDVPDGGNARQFFIQVLDAERNGKDKPLGSISLDLVDVLKMDGDKKGKWIPLDGADSGEILLAADFLDSLGRKAEDVLKDLLKSDQERKKSSVPLDKYGMPVCGDDDKLVKLNIIKAKDLIKTDLIGKSDPYALVKCGKQQDKTPVAKNTQNPEWNHTSELIVPINQSNTINIEVFDHDKLGKDKSLGKVELDLADLEDMEDVEGDQGRWFPLKGVKSGQILISADILDSDNPSGQSAPFNNLSNKSRNKSLSSPLSGQGPNDGKARVHLIKAKDLMNTDKKGKSDPYAAIKYGSQKFKTPTVKNSLEPEWDAEVEFDFPEGDEKTIKIEVFDEDKFSPDTSLGTVELSTDDLANMDPESGYWYPLSGPGVKSGEILLTGDIIDNLDDLDDDNINRVRGKSSTKDVPRSGTAGGPASSDIDHLPEGQVNVKLIKAKDLIKADMFGKSDPYAVLKYGNQKDKTNVAKNTQNPEWNHDSNFDVPDGPDQTLTIEVFDSDKIGKDKSLGKLDLDLEDLIASDGEGSWYPLKGVKSGEILLSSDFLPLDALGSDGVKGQQGTDLPGDSKNKNAPGSKNDKKKSGALGAGDDIPDGVVHLELVKAKDLDNEDKKSKSDPYAVVKYGKQKAKTNTIKNTLNPQWNFSTDFNVPDGSNNEINIEVFDNDRFGRDPSLGKLDLDIGELLNNDLSDGKWYPLTGSKAGQVFIASDFVSGDSGQGIARDKSGLPIGGKGTGSADPSKVRVFK